MKNLLLKSPYRVLLYKEITNLPLLPEPVVTRWKTWIKNAVFYAENFNKITEFLQKLDSSQSEDVADVKILSENRYIKIELLAVHKFNFLV